MVLGGQLPGLGDLGEEARELLCKMKGGARRSMWSSDGTFPLRNRTRRIFSSWEVCAVVSSGGVLNQYAHGPLIDEADLVFRFNGAPVDGFEKFVGTRDDVRIVNNEYFKHVFLMGYTPRWISDLYPAQVYAMNTSTSYVCVWDDWSDAWHYWDFFKYAAASNHEVEMDLLEPVVHKTLTRDIRNIYADMNLSAIDGESWIPSTGALGMYVAMTICDKVYAFGMAGTNLSSAGANHYFEPWSEKPTWHRTWDLEKDLWRRLSSNPDGWDIDSTDLAIIPGFSRVECPGDDEPVVFHEVPHQPSLTSTLTRLSLVVLTPLPVYVTARILLRNNNASRSIQKLDVRVVLALFVYGCAIVAMDVFTLFVEKRTGGTYPWDAVMVVLLTEVSKGLTSGVLLALESRKPPFATEHPDEHGSVTDGASEDGDDEDSESRRLWLVACLRLAPVAALYALNNFALGSLLRGLRWREYLVWTNSRVVFSVLFWMMYFQSSLTWHRWLGVVFLFFGGLLRTFPLGQRGPLSLAIWDMVFVGLLSPAVSSAAAVLNEGVLKDGSLMRRFGVNYLNLILYAEGFVVLLVSHVCSCSLTGADYAWHAPLEKPIFWIIVMSTVLGLALSRILAYAHAGAVAKTIAGGVGDISAVFLAPLLDSSFHYVVVQLCAAVWVCCSICVYFLPWLTVAVSEFSNMAEGWVRHYDERDE